MYRTLVLFALLLAAWSPAGAADRVKLPAMADVERADKLVRDLFKDEFAKTPPAAKAALAARLFAQAGETTDDPAAQFVLLRNTAELAAAGGDPDLAIKACTTLRERFDGPLADVLEPTLKLVVAKSAAPDANLAVTGFLLKAIDDAVAVDDLDGAIRLHKLAEGTAAKAKNVRTASQVAARGKDLDAVQKEAVKLPAAMKALEADPKDPDACLTVGKYLCFQKGDWARGLPLLARCSEPALKAAAAKDLADSAEAADLLQAADAWYDLLGTLAGTPRRVVQVRAYALYAKALPELSGLSKTKAEKRLQELEPVATAKADTSELWPLLRTAAKNKLYETLPPMGGAFGEKEYTDLQPDGALLIGFHYTLKKFFDKDLIDHFQPIYLTASGEKLGPALGSFRGSKKLTLKAKPNYAIGKMAIRGGGLWGGVNCHFMRVEGTRLNANDTYESGWIGHKDQPDSPFLGDGRPIIGIHGKLQKPQDGGGVCSIGLYVIGEKPKKE